VRGRGVVDHLLEVGRAESCQFTLASFSPAEVVLQVLLESAESTDSELAGHLAGESGVNERLAALAQSGIQLSIAPGAEQLRMFQDQMKFKLTVSNLIQNALHYRRTRVDVVLHHELDHMLIIVTDDGPGVAPEHHAAVFERYKQIPANDGLERQGHGLGLAGALILARRMGGDISLDSVPGSGATFRLLIPYGQTSAQANPSMARGATEHV
jgi:two-component system, OmpR family, sensor kinase